MALGVTPLRTRPVRAQLFADQAVALEAAGPVEARVRLLRLPPRR